MLQHLAETRFHPSPPDPADAWRRMESMLKRVLAKLD
jgi:hypothetical protein